MIGFIVFTALVQATIAASSFSDSSISSTMVSMSLVPLSLYCPPSSKELIIIISNLNSPNAKSIHLALIIGPVVGGLGLLVMTCTALLYLVARKRRRPMEIIPSTKGETIDLDGSPISEQTHSPSSNTLPTTPPTAHIPKPIRAFNHRASTSDPDLLSKAARIPGSFNPNFKSLPPPPPPRSRPFLFASRQASRLSKSDSNSRPSTGESVAESRRAPSTVGRDFGIGVAGREKRGSVSPRTPVTFTREPSASDDLEASTPSDERPSGSMRATSGVDSLAVPWMVNRPTKSKGDGRPSTR
jgi:hypothetical protein